MTQGSYESRVQAALKDAGTEHQAEDAVKLVGWSIRQGDNLPWWKYHKDRILDIEGGYRNVHSTVMALTIGLLVKHPELSLADAATQAGDEYRASIRRQWDVGYGPEDAPISLEAKAERIAGMMGTNNGNAMSANEVRDGLLHKYGQKDEPPAPFDETQMTDPRLIQAWELATEKEREVLRLVADGITIQQASAHVGGSNSIANMRMLKLRQRLEKAGVKATGAAC